jgi:hypothetical protein
MDIIIFTFSLTQVLLRSHIDLRPRIEKLVHVGFLYRQLVLPFLLVQQHSQYFNRGFKAEAMRTLPALETCNTGARLPNRLAWKGIYYH